MQNGWVQKKSSILLRVMGSGFYCERQTCGDHLFILKGKVFWSNSSPIFLITTKTHKIIGKFLTLPRWRIIRKLKNCILFFQLPLCLWVLWAKNGSLLKEVGKWEDYCDIFFLFAFLILKNVTAIRFSLLHTLRISAFNLVVMTGAMAASLQSWGQG